MMRYALLIKFGLSRLGRPSLQHGIVILVVADGNILVDVVADGFGFGMQLDEFSMGLRLLLLLGLFELLLLFEQVVCIFFGLLLGANLLLDGVDLGADLCGVVLRAAVVCFRKKVQRLEMSCVYRGLVLAFEIGDNLIYNLDRGVALLLRVANFLHSWVN